MGRDLATDGREDGPPSTGGRRPALLWGLRLAGLASAGLAQGLVHVQPWLSLLGFFLGMAMFAAAERLSPPAPAPRRAAARQQAGRLLWRPVAGGAFLCILAGVAVAGGLHPYVTHSLWLAGLALLAAGTLRAAWAERPWARPRAASVAAVALVLIVSGALFCWELTSIPPEVHGDDAEVGLDAIRLLEMRPFNLFATSWFELPRFHAVPTAIGLKIFGTNLLGLRATSAALGMATAVLLFALCQRLWGLELALLSSLLLVSQRFFIHLSRTGYHYIDSPFLSVLVLWLFLRVWQDRRLGSAVWCGIALGLGIQTYYASRLVPLLLVATFALWSFGARREELWARGKAFALIVIAAVATAAPLIGHFSGDWEALWARTSETSVFSPAAREHLAHGYGTDQLGSILLIQARAALTLFNATGDTSVQYGYGAPLLEPIGAVLFVLGVAMACARLRERRHQLLMLWLGIPLVAGAALTIDAPFYPRISGLLPFAAVLMALPVQRILISLRDTPAHGARRWVAPLVAVGLLGAIFTSNVHSYFIDYAPNHRHSLFPEISAWIRRHGAGRVTYMVASDGAASLFHGTVSFLTRDYDREDIEDLDRFLADQPPDPSTSVFIVMPAGEHLLSKLAAALGPLDVQEHRTIHGDVGFFTAIPRAAGASTESPIGGRAPPDKSRLGGALGIASLLAAPVIALVLFLWWWPSRRRGGAGRSHLATWQRVLFGPGPREPRFELPRAAGFLLLALIVVLAAWLRIARLDALPPGFYCDEAGLGYNAYSILRTGRDETGTFLPLYVWSFDTSFKNPVFIYASMLPLSILGPSEVAVRLTSALFGIATVVGMFFLGRALMGVRVGLLAALFLAVCPWHLHFSRIAFELISFPLVFVLGITALVSYTRGRRTLPLAMVLMGLCLYTYVPAKLFVPLFLGGFALAFRRQLLRRRRESVLAVALLAATAAPVILFDVSHWQRTGQYFEETTVLERQAPASELLGDFAANYAAFFSGEFLFAQGDTITRHAVQKHGELYPLFAPLLIIGLLTAAGRRDEAMLLPLWWLVLYPLAPALLNEIPSASRGIIGAPAFCLLAAIGGGAVLRWATQITANRAVAAGLQLGAVALGAAFLVPQVEAYWSLYAEQYPRYAAKHYTGFQYGHRQVVEYFLDHYDEYDELILTASESNQPEIFLAFFAGLRGEPSAAAPPFQHPPKMSVGTPEELYLYKDAPRQLFALVPDDLLILADYEVVGEVTAPDGSPAFLLVDVKKPKRFVYTWQLAGPYPADDVPPAPHYDPAAAPASGPRDRAWQRHDMRTASVRLDEIYGHETDHSCAWAVNFAHSDREREVRVHAGFDDYGEVWINGARVPLRERAVDHPLWVDTEEGSAVLRPGLNSVAVQTCDADGTWLFYFRLANPDGSEAEGIAWEYGNEWQ